MSDHLGNSTGGDHDAVLSSLTRQQQHTFQSSSNTLTFRLSHHSCFVLAAFSLTHYLRHPVSRLLFWPTNPLLKSSIYLPSTTKLVKAWQSDDPRPDASDLPLLESPRPPATPPWPWPSPLTKYPVIGATLRRTSGVDTTSSDDETIFF